MEQLNFDENIYDTIRKNIKKYRNIKGMTAAQLAEAVGLSHDFIRQIESKKVGYNFSVETIYKISVALGVSLDKFVEDSDDTQSEDKTEEDEDDVNHIEPLRIVQWEVDSGLSKSSIRLDGLMYSGELTEKQFKELHDVKLIEFAMQSRIRNYTEIYAKNDAVSRINYAVHDPKRFITVIIERIQSLFSDKNILFEIECDIDDKSVIFDSRRTKLILYNIISNSIIHSRKKNLKIKVKTSIRGDDFIIEITDDGRCIKRELRAGMFELSRFREASRPEDLRMLKGLGLAVSRKMARDMEGDVVYMPSSNYNRFEISISQSERRNYINEEAEVIIDSEEMEMYMAEALLSL